MTDSHLKDFGPQKLFDSAMEEVLFGGGKFAMAYNDPQNAHKIAAAWHRYMVESQWFNFLEVKVSGNRIDIMMSDQAIDILAEHGIGPLNLEDAGMRSDTKLAMVERIFKLIRENLI